MTLLNPIWLWALGSLSIPIAIHLLSRKEGKTIRIGSIRFLAETSTSKFSSIRLNEVVLLAIRSLLILLIVLFLASLLVSTPNSKVSQKWVVIEKGLENTEQLKNLLDSLQADDYEIHSLLPGFPLPEDDTLKQAPDYYKLSEELSQKHVQAIVIAGNSITRFKGKRISLPANITWLSHPAPSTQNLSPDAILLLDTVTITLAYDKDFQYDKRIMLAALKALPAKISIEETEVSDLKNPITDWLIWLSTDKLTHENQSLRFSEDASSDLIVQDNKNQWTLTERLNEENAIEQHLSIQLMNMLFSDQIKQEIHKHDKRSLPDEVAWSQDNEVQSINTPEAGLPADQILILVIALVFIAERILAFYRKQ